MTQKVLPTVRKRPTQTPPFQTPSSPTHDGSGGPRRRQVLAGSLLAAAAMRSKPATAIGEGSLFRLARLDLPDLPDPRPNALTKLAWELERRTSLETRPEPVHVRTSDPNLFRFPMLILNGDRGFAPPSDSGVARLRRFLTYGGFLFIDSAEGRAGGAFDRSVRALLARVLPGNVPVRIDDDHVLWKSFYMLHNRPFGRIVATPDVEGVQRDRRLAVIYSQNDVCGAMDRDGFGRFEHEVIPGGETQREMTFRFAVNVIMYAFCLDYKEEQAHIDFILRTRRSRF